MCAKIRRLPLENNVLVIPDMHYPFVHRHAIDFLLDTKRRLKCNKVIMIGDLVDNHAISYHEHCPDGYSPAYEMAKADKGLKSLFRAFQNVIMVKGNHDILPSRKGKTAGLPRRCFQEFRKIWNLPKTWQDKFEHIENNVLYTHGTGYSGLHPHYTACMAVRQSCVIGHCHSVAGVEWSASSQDIIFGLSVGCLIDRRSYAFSYGSEHKRKPILGCGVVFNNGTDAQFIPMKL